MCVCACLSVFIILAQYAQTPLSYTPVYSNREVFIGRINQVHLWVSKLVYSSGKLCMLHLEGVFIITVRDC